MPKSKFYSEQANAIIGAAEGEPAHDTEKFFFTNDGGLVNGT